jgi:hypothetical protein
MRPTSVNWQPNSKTNSPGNLLQNQPHISEVSEMALFVLPLAVMIGACRIRKVKKHPTT